MTAHAILATAMPRLLAASAVTAILTGLVIRAVFRPRQSHMDTARVRRPRHRR